MKVSRSVLQYKSIKNDAMLIEMLQQKTEQHPKEGFWKCFMRLRNEGVKVNHKRAHRVYKSIGLSVRKKSEKTTS